MAAKRKRRREVVLIHEEEAMSEPPDQRNVPEGASPACMVLHDAFSLLRQDLAGRGGGGGRGGQLLTGACSITVELPRQQVSCTSGLRECLF